MSSSNESEGSGSDGESQIHGESKKIPKQSELKDESNDEESDSSDMEDDSHIPNFETVTLGEDIIKLEKHEYIENDESDNSSDSHTTPSSTKPKKSTLPEKSKQKYESMYHKFMEWKKNHNDSTLSEDVLMEYFLELSRTMKPSTLWAHYSMLRHTISINDNVDISTYSKLIDFLKKKSSGFKSKSSKVLTSVNVDRFLNEAPDDEFLATKVAMILGITGACRREELCNIVMEDIKDDGITATIQIPKSDTNTRTFTIYGKFYSVLKKYISLRPKNIKTNRLFLNYHNGKCTHQVIGINKFGKMPRQIAGYLDLPDADSYTGHSFRRTSVTLLANAGVNIANLKRIQWGNILKSAESPPQSNKINNGKDIQTETPKPAINPSTSKNENITETNAKKNSKEPPFKKFKISGNDYDINVGPSTSDQDPLNFHAENDEQSSSEPSMRTVTSNKNVYLNFYNCSNITIHIVKKS